MTEKIKKRSRWFKRILFGGLIFLLIGVSIYWYVATEKFADTNKRKAAYIFNALDFIKEFQRNDSIANNVYTDKIITINGTVSEIEAADTTVNIKFIDPQTGSYAIFAFQEQHLAEAKKMKAGDKVSIKGSCSGGIYSEILGTEAVTFKRCALNK
jgi:tRNA_anti-like